MDTKAKYNERQGSPLKKKEQHSLRSRHTRPGNKLRLRQRALAELELLIPLIIEDEDILKDSIPLIDLLGVVKKKMSSHGKSREVARPISKDESNLRAYPAHSKKPKVMSPHATKETHA